MPFRIAFDGFGYPFAGRDGINHGRRAGGIVAARKNAGDGGLPGHRVGLETAAFALDIEVADELFVHHLADGDDDLLGLNGGEIVFVKGRAEAFLVVKDPGAAFELDASDGAVAEDALGAPAIADLDVFREGRFDFLLVGGHLMPLFEADHFNIPGAQAQRGPGHVHRHVAAADDQHPVFHRGLPGRSRVPEEFHAVQDALDVLAFHAELAALLGAGGNEDGGVIVAGGSGG